MAQLKRKQLENFATSIMTIPLQLEPRYQQIGKLILAIIKDNTCTDDTVDNIIDELFAYINDDHNCDPSILISMLEKVVRRDPVAGINANVVTGNTVKPVKPFLTKQRYGFCFACGNFQSKIHNCGRCFASTYCDQVCQVNDWARHKEFCSPQTTEQNVESFYESMFAPAIDYLMSSNDLNYLTDNGKKPGVLIVTIDPQMRMSEAAVKIDLNADATTMTTTYRDGKQVAGEYRLVIRRGLLAKVFKLIKPDESGVKSLLQKLNEHVNWQLQCAASTNTLAYLINNIKALVTKLEEEKQK